MLFITKYILLLLNNFLEPKIKDMSDTETLILQANTLIEKGNIEEGCHIFNMILEESPDNFTALSGRGVAESLLGDHAAAIETLKTAHLKAPREIRIILNLAHAYIASGAGQDALNHFRKSYNIDNTNTEASYWLGFLNEKKGNFAEAVLFYERTIELEPQNRQAYLQLADTFFLLDKVFEAFSVLKKAEVVFEGDSAITFLKGKLLSKSMPDWHLPMLHDKLRNNSYEKAINAVVKSDDIVLDIGTGSGLLAMMAARAGAKHVYACEMNPILAAMAREIVEANELQDKITIIDKNSSLMVIGEDMPEKADVLVTEIFDSAVIGEKVLPIMQHAWSFLLKDNARVIPERAYLYGALAQCPGLQELHYIDKVNGFDLSIMNQLTRPYAMSDMQINFAASDDSKVLSEPFPIYVFDFQRLPVMEFETQESIKILEPGNADSVLLWFDLELAPGIKFSTQNYQTQNHWRPASQILQDHEVCKSGEIKKLQVLFSDFFTFKVQSS